MGNRLISLMALALLALTAACGTTPPPLPTLAANALPTETTGATETPTVDVDSGGRPTLPPLPSTTPLPTSTATQTQSPTEPAETEAVTNSSGIIYYLYNNDAIVSVPADRSRREELLIRANGGRISDVSVSPDGAFFVYVAPGAGSAREVFVSSRDGSYTQRVSCLGFARVLAPVWQPNGDLIAFLAAQTETTPLDIYVARLSGAGNCPTDNGQRLLARLAPETPPTDGSISQAGLNASELIWSSDGTRLFYTDRSVYVVDIASGATLLVSQATGFGPDYSLTFNSADQRLYFLHTTQESAAEGLGQVAVADVRTLSDISRRRELSFTGSYLAWGTTGAYMLIVEGSSISVYTPSGAQTTTTILTGLTLPPNPIFSPDDAQIAYIATTAELPNVQQVFVMSRAGDSPTLLTAHSEGTVADLIWLAD